MADTPRLVLFLPTPTDLANPTTILNNQYDKIDLNGPTIVVDSLPAAGTYDGQLYYLKTDGVVYKWNQGDTSWYYWGSRYKPFGVLGFVTVNQVTCNRNQELLIAKCLIPPSGTITGATPRTYRAGYSVTLEQSGSAINPANDTQVRVCFSNRYNDVNGGDQQISIDYTDVGDDGIEFCPQIFAGESDFTPYSDSWQTVGLFLKRGDSNDAKIAVNAGGYDTFYVEDLGVLGANN